MAGIDQAAALTWLKTAFFSQPQNNRYAVAVLFEQLATQFDADRKRKSLPKNKKVLKEKGLDVLMQKDISEKSIKNTVILLEKRNTQRLIKSTHQTNGTYIYRINTKLKTYEHISWNKKKKKSFFKGWKC